MSWKGDELIPPVYMPIADAYAFVELILDGETEGGENPWLLISRSGKNPAQVAKMITDQLVREGANPMPGQSAKTSAAIVRAVAQSTLPLFLTYVAGKMGAV